LLKRKHTGLLKKKSKHKSVLGTVISLRAGSTSHLKATINIPIHGELHQEELCSVLFPQVFYSLAVQLPPQLVVSSTYQFPNTTCQNLGRFSEVILVITCKN
jgi:hypothetical protein